jgi:hypothetical protein
MIGSYWPAAPDRNPHQWSNPHDCGQWSNGPAGPCTLSGVRCHLPNPTVTYPFSCKIRGRCPSGVWPGVRRVGLSKAEPGADAGPAARRGGGALI